MTKIAGAQVVVIGAGASGLATATLLADRGAQVSVVDRGERPGGRAGVLTLPEHPGFRWDTGPSWYLMPDAFEHFYALLGTSAEKELELERLDPGYRFFPEGCAPLDIPHGKEEVAALAESLEPGAGAVMRSYLAQAGEVYDIACRRFLYTTFESPAPFLHLSVARRALLLLRLLSTSLEGWVHRQVHDTRLRQLLTYPAVFLSGEPRTVPALYHLMSHTDLVQGVRYPQGGFAAVMASVRRLAEERGVRFLQRTEATRILTTPQSQVRGVRIRREDGAEEDIPADHVVSTVDRRHSELDLLPPAQRTWGPRHFEKQNPGIGTVLVMAGVRGELPQLRHHNLFFRREWEKDFAQVRRPMRWDPRTDLASEVPWSRSIYVSVTSKTERDVAPAGHENLFILVPVPADPRLGHGDLHHPEASPAVAHIQREVLALIARWAGIPDLAERVVVSRSLGPLDFLEQHHAQSGGAIGPAHTLRQSAFFRGAVRSAKVANLWYAGATTRPGVGIPMCLISAENVLKGMEGDRSCGPLDVSLR